MSTYSGLRSPWLTGAARWLFGATLVVVLIRSTDLNVRSWTEPATLLGLGNAVVLLLAAIGLSAFRWKLVLGPGSPGLVYLIRVYLIGWFFSLFLPTSVGGDAVRAAALAHSRLSAGVALSSIIIERLAGMFALVTYLGLGVLIAPDIIAGLLSLSSVEMPPGLVLAGALASIIVGAVAVVAFRERLRRIRVLRDAFALLGSFSRTPARMAGAFVVSMLIQALYILVWMELARAFGIAVPWLAFLIYVPFISLAAMLPVTLGGLGVREGSWTLLLSAHGIAGGDAVAFSLAYYFAGLLIGLIGAAIFVWSGMAVAIPQPQPAEQLSRPGTRTAVQAVEP